MTPVDANQRGSWPAAGEEEKRGHWPTLLACFLHFDLSFMLWVLLGALGIFVAEEAQLDAAEKATVVAVPILSGAMMRFPLGLLSDRFGAKRVGVGMLAFLFVPLTVGWLGGGAMPQLLLVGAMLGTAGASFAVALPLASRLYPPKKQGLAMGIAAAGNSGTVITNLVAPRLAKEIGWHGVLGVAMIPLAVVLLTFILLAKDVRAKAPPLPLRKVLRHTDLWWLCLFYSVTFGGYVGLGTFLPILLRDQYALSPLDAGYVTALLAFAGSASRPLGGWLADRVGGSRLLSGLLGCVSVGYGLASTLPTIETMTPLLLGVMICLGMGNGAVFQLVPQRFRDEIGAATGIIGAIGGFGGFLLPMLLGTLKVRTSTFGTGFLCLAGLAFVATVTLGVLLLRQRPWRFSWREASSPPGG